MVRAGFWAVTCLVVPVLSRFLVEASLMPAFRMGFVLVGSMEAISEGIHLWEYAGLELI